MSNIIKFDRSAAADCSPAPLPTASSEVDAPPRSPARRCPTCKGTGLMRFCDRRLVTEISCTSCKGTGERPSAAPGAGPVNDESIHGGKEPES